MLSTVLVIDDDPDCIDMLDTVLTPEGYRVIGCLDSAQAVTLARQVHPSAIMVDLVMPDQDGWMVIAGLRAEPQTAQIPIVVCTGDAVAASRQLATLQAWGYAVLLKPFEINDLLQLLARATAQRKAS